MLLRWSEKIASFFVQKNLLSLEQYDWAVYALQIRLMQCVVVPILVIVGAILSSLGSILCFLLSFSMLRRKIGGYHASTPLACFFISLITIIIASTLGMNTVCKLSSPAQLISLLACVLILLGHSLFYRYIKHDYGRSKSYSHACNILILLAVLSFLLLQIEAGIDLAHAITLGVFTAIFSLLPKNKQGGPQE